MMTKYHEGKREALEALGLRPRTQDNHLVRGFVDALGDGRSAGAAKREGNRPLHRQTWGKRQDYVTSDQEVSGGGIRL